MVFLPILYLALVALAGWGVYYHATAHTWILGLRSGGVFGLVLYLGPIVAGCVVVFFMAKPLLARRTVPATERRLSRAEERFLFAFVERLCRAVGAPMPHHIQVDLQVNAFAGGDLGLVQMRKGELTLGIGLPLVAGLSLTQFTGVLAHEFGHFAQGVGMRLTRTIRGVNFWFARVVYERDRWDESLDVWRGSEFAWVALVASLSSFAVWLSRQLLKGLMHIGHALSCYLTRQMEYDADRYGVSLVGAKTFEFTVARLQQLNAGEEMAFQQLLEGTRNGILPKNLPAAIESNSSSLPAEVEQGIRAQIESGTTGWLDTHPSDRKRIDRANRRGATPQFVVPGPATQLFTDFESLSESVTLDYYRSEIGDGINEQQLVDHTELPHRVREMDEMAAVAESYCHGTLTWVNPLFLKEAPPPEGDLVAALKRAREQFESLLPDSKRLIQRLHEAEQHRANMARYDFQRRHGLPVPGLSTATNLGEEAKALAEADAAVEARSEELQIVNDALSTRMRIALQRAKEAPTCLLDTLSALETTFPWIRSTLRATSAASALAGDYALIEGLEHAAVSARFSTCRIEEVAPPSELPETLMPFGSGDPETETVGDYLRRHAADHSLEGASLLVDAYFVLYFRVMRKLAALASAVESELGLPPIEPPEPARPSPSSSSAPRRRRQSRKRRRR